MSQRILQGLRVLDFTWVLAGPYSTRILADFGAEVIKVQTAKTSKGAESNKAGYFNTWNRNKRSITLDMSFPEAREIALSLARISDVVVENFSPRVMANWRLTYEQFKEVNPKVIMASMSAMGQTGPWKDYVAFGPTLQGLSGLSYCTAYDEGLPVGLGFAYGDHVAGLYAAIAILAALEHRSKTGLGQYIDLSEYEALCTMMGPTLLGAQANHAMNQPDARWPEGSAAVYSGCYPCLGEDRWCVITVSTEDQWQALCKATGNPHWLETAKIATRRQGQEFSSEVNELIGRWTSRLTPEDVVNLLQGVGIAAGVVQNSEDLFQDPQLAARGFFRPIEHPVLGSNFADRSPVRLAGNDQAIEWKAAPELGEDNQYVFEQLLGLTREEISSYQAQGIFS